jgi:hypothetical protein
MRIINDYTKPLSEKQRQTIRGELPQSYKTKVFKTLEKAPLSDEQKLIITWNAYLEDNRKEKTKEKREYKKNYKKPKFPL